MGNLALGLDDQVDNDGFAEQVWQPIEVTALSLALKLFE
jgi:hypothetical protein